MMFGDDRFMKTSSLAPGGLFIRAIDVPALGWGWEIPVWLLVDGLGHATHTGGASTDRKNSRRLIYACVSYRPHFIFFLLSLLLLLFFWPLLFLTMAMDVNYFSEAHRWRRDGGGIQDVLCLRTHSSGEWSCLQILAWGGPNSSP